MSPMIAPCAPSTSRFPRVSGDEPLNPILDATEI